MAMILRLRAALPPPAVGDKEATAVVAPGACAPRTTSASRGSAAAAAGAVPHVAARTDERCGNAGSMAASAVGGSDSDDAADAVTAANERRNERNRRAYCRSRYKRSGAKMRNHV